jgi:hypothetical protein
MDQIRGRAVGGATQQKYPDQLIDLLRFAIRFLLTFIVHVSPFQVLTALFEVVKTNLKRKLSRTRGGDRKH